MVTALDAVRAAFSDARGCIARSQTSKVHAPDTVYYWSVYLSALEAVAFRARESALAIEINEFRSKLITLKQ